MLAAVAITFALMREKGGGGLTHRGGRVVFKMPCSAFSDPLSDADQRPAATSPSKTDPVYNPRIAGGVVRSRNRLVARAPLAQTVDASEAGLDPEVRSIQAALRGIKQDPLVRARLYADVDAVILKVRNHELIPRNLMVDGDAAFARSRGAQDRGGGESPGNPRVSGSFYCNSPERTTAPNSPVRSFSQIG